MDTVKNAAKSVTSEGDQFKKGLLDEADPREPLLTSFRSSGSDS